MVLPLWIEVYLMASFELTCELKTHFPCTGTLRSSWSSVVNFLWLITPTYSYSDPDSKQGDVIRFGQHITLTTLPNEGGKVSTLP